MNTPDFFAHSTGDSTGDLTVDPMGASRGASPVIPLERLPDAEALRRWNLVRRHLRRLAPDAAGLLVFSRLNIYYLTGTLGNGLLWLPAFPSKNFPECPPERLADAEEGASPVLLLRKGKARAEAESPVPHIREFRSYSEVPDLLADAGFPGQGERLAGHQGVGRGGRIAAEMGGLPWSLAVLFQERVPGLTFVPGDAALACARSIKSPWELNKMREAGERHRQGLCDVLPMLIRPGMTEREIAVLCIDAYLQLGHSGLMRMNAPGEEVFFGHVAADDSGNYPHYYNGPMGFRGTHPAAPCLGSDTVWRPGSPLTVDMGFSFEGYSTDKTQMFWAGSAATMPDAARRAYDLCVEIHDRAAAALRPGVAPSTIWREALNRAEGPFAQGFMGLGGNQLSFLGHGIGLAVDEKPVIARGFDEPLEEGMTLALEPKIGLPGIGMVGLENTFEVTPDGGRSLTGSDTGIVFL